MFSGMAILCKWLVGLLVYFGWFILRIMQKNIKMSNNKDILISLLITILISMPWQILTFIWYPEEASSAYKLNSIHFTVPIEGHGGDFWYHFDMFNIIYGSIASFIIIPSFLLFFKRCNDKKLFYSILSMVLIVYLFFSLAATKMPSFTIIVSMIVFIAFASMFDYLLNYLKQFVHHKKIVSSLFIISILTIVLLRFDIEYLQEKHTFWKDSNYYSKMLSHNKAVFNLLNLPSNTVLFNVKGRHYIEAMFYTGLPAYNFIPTYEQYKNMKEKERNIAIFTPNNTEISDYLKNDSSIIIIDKEIKGYE